MHIGRVGPLLSTHYRVVHNIPDRFRECLAEILRHNAILGWAADHFEGDSRCLAGMFLHNSVDGGPYLINIEYSLRTRYRFSGAFR